MIQDSELVRLGLPKGRMYEGVSQLLADAGIRVRLAAREYRPHIGVPGFEAKLLKPQAIVKMLQHGFRDLGFAGADWVDEFRAPLVELLDTQLDPVRIVAAAPSDRPRNWKDVPFVVATELEQITARWLQARGYRGEILRSFGSTEVYPPEDADCIVDVVSTGATLQANGLEVVDEIMRSSTRLYASPTALESPAKLAAIESLVLVLRAVLEARQRVLIEMNVSEQAMESLIGFLPCMREPTISRLHGSGYAVKVAAPKANLPELISQIKARGGTDIVVTQISHIVP